MQRLELFYIRLIGLDDGVVGIVSADGVVRVLLRDRIGLKQILVAILGDLRQSEIGLCRGEVAARLLELLVDFRRVDLGEKLALFHAGSNVYVPLVYVAAGARVNRSRHVGFHVARQHKLVRRRGTLRRDDVDQRHSQGRSLGADDGMGADTLQDAEDHNPRDYQKNDEADEPGTSCSMFPSQNGLNLWPFRNNLYYCS